MPDVMSLYVVRQALDDAADRLSEVEGDPEVELLVDRLRRASTFTQGYAEGSRPRSSLFGF